MSRYKTFLTIPEKIVNIILAGAGAVLVFVNLYNVYNYTFIGHRVLTSFAGKIYYLFVPVSLGVLLIVSLRLKRAYKLAVAYLLGAVILLGYLGEAELTREGFVASELPFWGFGPGTEKKRSILMIARAAGINFDTRDLPTVVEDLRMQEIDAVPFIGASFMAIQPDGSFRSMFTVNRAEFVPMGGISNKLTIVCGLTGKFTSYNSDERGFNNPYGIWSSRHLKIAALGQSRVQGFCTREGKNFIDLVREYYPTSLNLGFSGEGPLMQLGAISEYLTSLRPEIVLWFYLEGIDLGDLQYERKSRLAVRYMEDGFKQNLISRQSEIDEFLTKYTENYLLQRKSARAQPRPDNRLRKIVSGLKMEKVRRKLGLVHGEDASVLSQLDDANIKTFGESLTLANRRVAKWGGKLYLVYLPGWKRFGSKSPFPEQERSLIYKAACAAKVPVVDTLSGFYAQKDPLSLFPLGIFGHYNEAGHRVVADEVVKFLAEEKADAVTSGQCN